MIQVDEMIIRVPGMGAEEARSMGETVAGRMAAMMPDSIDNKSIGELNIKLSLSPGMNSHAMADSIATQILQQLKML
jgi:hypothetical protein